ncbi:MAG: hypothetical protein ACLVKO_11955 [Dysgonomonas sp.]
MEENNDLYDLYKQYTQVLENNNYAFYKTIPCYYVVLRNKRIEENSKIVSKNEKVKTKAIRKIKRMLYPIYSALLK